MIIPTTERQLSEDLRSFLAYSSAQYRLHCDPYRIGGSKKNYSDIWCISKCVNDAIQAQKHTIYTFKNNLNLDYTLDDFQSR